jgi:hypothetical protein
MTLWNKFEKNFGDIINDIEEYKKILEYSIIFNQNLLFYSYIGFPIDLFIDEIIKKKFKINQIYRKEMLWNKSIIYNENQYFFEIDLDNPNMPRKLNNLNEMLLFIIKTKSINTEKHLIIVKNIDKLNDMFFAFRIILEKYYNNCYFICFTNKINKIETPIKSRFFLFRLRLFKTDEIQMIFNKYLKTNLNKNLLNNRNIIFNIFISQTEKFEPLLVDDDFCNLHYPPLKTFLKSKYTLNDIRQLSYKYCQYNIGIREIVEDLLKIDNKNYKKIIETSIIIDELLNNTNKCREPMFIEAFLCQILI